MLFFDVYGGTRVRVYAGSRISLLRSDLPEPAQSRRLDSSSRTNATVKFFDFATGKKTSISTLDKPPSMGLALSPDGRSILYVQNELAESSIMLVKNFR